MVHIFALNCMSISFGCHNTFSACFGHLPTLSLTRSCSKPKLCSLMLFFDSFSQSLYNLVGNTIVRQQRLNNKTETEGLEEERRIKNLFRSRYVQMQESYLSPSCLYHSLRALLQCGLYVRLKCYTQIEASFCESRFGLISLLFECLGFVLNMLKSVDFAR